VKWRLTRSPRPTQPNWKRRGRTDRERGGESPKGRKGGSIERRESRLRVGGDGNKQTPVLASKPEIGRKGGKGTRLKEGGGRSKGGC